MSVMRNVSIPNYLCTVLSFIFVAATFIGGGAALAYSGDYYADVVFDVRDNGDVEISGISNHPDLAERVSSHFTSKDKGTWLLNASLDGVFSEYVFEVRFPKGAVLNYVRIPNRLSMEDDGGRIVVTSTGVNDSFYVVAQYSFDGSGERDSGFSAYYYIIGLVVLVVGLYYVYINFRGSDSSSDFLDGDKYYVLTERQKQIVSALKKSKGPMTQAELQKALGIPKASLSRNIDALVMKNIVAKESHGMTNVLVLKEMDN